MATSRLFSARGRVGGWWWGVLALIFGWYVSLSFQKTYPIIVYSVTIVDPIFVTFGQICNFRDPNLLTFYFYEM